MTKQTKAKGIPREVKRIVGERDDYTCIICGRPGIPNAHYIRRSQGGLGIEQNIVCLCPECHDRFDNGDKREEFGRIIKCYLKEKYPYCEDKDRIYKKYDW